MTYFNDGNLGCPTEIYGAPGTENHDILYPVVGQVYVPETQLYNVVHAVEYRGTTYFFENLVEFPVYRLCDVISYSPVNVLDENTLYRPTETYYSENVEQEIENIPGYDYQPSAEEILSVDSNEAMSASMDMNGFYSPGHVMNTFNYDNWWNTTYVHSQYGISDESDGIRQDRIIHYTEVHENRSLESIVSRNEINLQFEHMNYGWPYLRNSWCLNDVPCQESILDSMRSQEIVDASAVKAAVKYKKDSLYLIALSGKLYKKESLPVVDKLPAVQEVNEENSVIEYSNEKIENASQKEAVLHSIICTEQFEKVCRQTSVQDIKKMEVIQKINDNVQGVELKYENALKVKKIESVVQGNLFTTRSKKLNRRANIQVLDNLSNIEDVADEEYAVESCNKKLQKIKQPVLQTNIFFERVKNLHRRELIQLLQRMTLLEEVFDEVCVEQTCNNDTVKSHKFPNKAKKLHKMESIQTSNRIPVIVEIVDEECLGEPCIKDAQKIQRPAVKSNKFTKKAKKLDKRERIQAFSRLPLIKDIAEEECEVESCHENAPKIERPVIEEVVDEKCEVECYPINESEDTEKTYDVFLDKNNRIVNQLSPQENAKETVKVNNDNLSESFIVKKTPMVNVERFSLDKVKEIKKKDKILDTGKIKSSAKNTYKGMALLPLKEDADQSKSLESDKDLENGNESTEEPSQKSKKKRFQNLRKFLGRLLCCRSKEGPT